MTNNEALAILKSLGRNYVWLSEKTDYSKNTLYNVFSGKTRDLKKRMVAAFKAAFEAEEVHQAAAKEFSADSSPEIPLGHMAIYLGGEALERAERASRRIGADRVADFCRDAIRQRADEILAGNGGGGSVPKGKKIKAS